jgi:predicted transcriptional regulator
MKLFDSEWKLMEVLWASEPVTAKQLSVLAFEQIGWNKNTTYTVIKKLIEKDAISRTEPNFTCKSLLRKEDAVKAETSSFIDRVFKGSKKAFFASFLEDEDLSEAEIAVLKDMIEKK